MIRKILIACLAMGLTGYQNALASEGCVQSVLEFDHVDAIASYSVTVDVSPNEIRLGLKNIMDDKQLSVTYPKKFGPFAILSIVPGNGLLDDRGGNYRGKGIDVHEDRLELSIGAGKYHAWRYDIEELSPTALIPGQSHVVGDLLVSWDLPGTVGEYKSYPAQGQIRVSGVCFRR